MMNWFRYDTPIIIRGTSIEDQEKLTNWCMNAQYNKVNNYIQTHPRIAGHTPHGYLLRDSIWIVFPGESIPNKIQSEYMIFPLSTDKNPLCILIEIIQLDKSNEPSFYARLQPYLHHNESDLFSVSNVRLPKYIYYGKK